MEEIASDPNRFDAVEVTGWAHVRSVRSPGEDARKSLLLSPDLLPDRSRQLRILALVHAHPAVSARDPHLSQFVRPLNRQTAQFHGID